MSGESTAVDPSDFIDAEVIKQRLEALDKKLDEIIGRLEAIAASLSAY